jgi:hypothetical protein
MCFEIIPEPERRGLWTLCLDRRLVAEFLCPEHAWTVACDLAEEQARQARRDTRVVLRAADGRATRQVDVLA